MESRARLSVEPAEYFAGGFLISKLGALAGQIDVDIPRQEGIYA